MPYFDKSFLRRGGPDSTIGYDPDKGLQVLPIGLTTQLSLVGDDAEVVVDDESIATVQDNDKQDRRMMEQTAVTYGIRDVTIKGVSSGKTKLRAKVDGNDSGPPLDIVVVKNRDWRRVDDDSATPDMITALSSVPLRDAVLMVAEDQWHSRIGHKDKTSRYGFAGQEWCGLFCHWCWKRACKIRGVTNPLGDKPEKFLSVIKAISYTMDPASGGNLEMLRFDGLDPYQGDTNHRSQEFHDLGYQGRTLQTADMICWRHGLNSAQYQHMNLVYELNGSTLTSIDGNYSAAKPITVIPGWNMNAKISKTEYELVYIHVMV